MTRDAIAIPGACIRQERRQFLPKAFGRNTSSVQSVGLLETVTQHAEPVERKAECRCMPPVPACCQDKTD